MADAKVVKEAMRRLRPRGDARTDYPREMDRLSR